MSGRHPLSVHTFPTGRVVARIDTGSYRMDIHNKGIDTRGNPSSDLVHLWQITPRSPGVSPGLDPVCGSWFHVKGTMERGLVTCPKCFERMKK